MQFQQPGASSVTLNRVMSSDPSQIFGRITANGQVILTNPAGVYFGKDARVDVGGLVATTHGIGDADFMAGKSRFERNGSTASVVNEGELKAALGGYIALLAPEVRNQGAIIAHMGTVALASGEAVDLHFDSRNRLTSIRVEPSQIQALVDNRHAIEAPGGLILLAAQSMDRLLGGVVKNSGRIEANGLQEQGGRIVLSASHKLDNTGSISANATTGNTAGPAGKVEISAPEVVNSGSISATGSCQHSAGTLLVQATQLTQAANGRIDLSAPLQGGTLTVKTTGKVQLQGHVDVSATQDGQSSQGGVIDIAAQGNIEVTDATLNASGGQGGQIQLRAAAPAQPDNPNQLPDAPNEPGQGRLAMMGNSTLSTRGRNGKGGSTTLLGDHIDLLDNTAIDATGVTGGGNVLAGGDWQGSNGVYQATTVTMAEGVSIDASATEQGNGGKVVLWSDISNASATTVARGTLRAMGGADGGNGGRIETSGHFLDVEGIAISTAAPRGTVGEWLIDPYNITISSYSSGTGWSNPYTPGIDSVISASTVNSALGSSNVIISTGIAEGASSGWIDVTNGLSWSSGNDLTLLAAGDIKINADITHSGTGGLVLYSRTGSVSGSGTLNLGSASTAGSNLVVAQGTTVANNINLTGYTNFKLPRRTR